MELAAQNEILVKTEPSWDSVSVEDAPSSPVFIKDEPPSDGSVEVRSSCLDVSVREKILNTEASCCNATEIPLDETLKVERVEECGGPAISRSAAAPSSPVLIKIEPLSDSSLEVWFSCSGVPVKEEILNTEASCISASETPLDVTVKVERVKEECGVSARAAAKGLYASHAVTGKLVLGPTPVRRPKGRAPQEEQGERLDPYCCDHCGFTTARKSALAGHMRTHASHDTLVCKKKRTEKPYKCDQCSFSAVTKTHLKWHETMHTGERPFKCDQCNFTSRGKSELRVHKRVHGEKPYKCGQCSYAANQKGNLITHEKIHSRETLYNCGQCSYASVYKSTLVLHDRTHTGDRPYKCDQCSYAAAQKSVLLRHKKIHSGDRPYKCRQCSYDTLYKSHLIRHGRIHTGDKPYKCNRCSYATITKGNLILHERTHTGDKPYKCDECNYAAAQKPALLCHQKFHSGNRPYKCGKCSFTTTRLSNLKCHERIHTGEKQDTCSQDRDAASSYNSDIRVHERIHTGTSCEIPVKLSSSLLHTTTSTQ